jgi:hypothetical protein
VELCGVPAPPGNTASITHTEAETPLLSQILPLASNHRSCIRSYHSDVGPIGRGGAMPDPSSSMPRERAGTRPVGVCTRLDCSRLFYSVDHQLRRVTAADRPAVGSGHARGHLACISVMRSVDAHSREQPGMIPLFLSAIADAHRGPIRRRSWKVIFFAFPGTSRSAV